MVVPNDLDVALLEFVQAIATGHDDVAMQMLSASPALATACFIVGATRKSPRPHYIDRIDRYFYAGDTALHMAAAAYQTGLVKRLIIVGADTRAKNRLGGEPLHAAAVGTPGSSRWNPRAQAETVTCLIEAGADPNALDKNGVAPVHRAVRTRCAAAVKALLDGGADAERRNRNGSTPMLLAVLNTGRGGAGSPDAKAQQREIVCLLRQHGASGA